jgi:hypothetical protein
MSESRMTLYRLHILIQTAESTIAAGMLSIRENVRDHALDMRLDHTISLYHISKIYAEWSVYVMHNKPWAEMFPRN